MTMLYDRQFPEYLNQYYIITKSRNLVLGRYIGKDATNRSKVRYAFIDYDCKKHYVHRRSIFTSVFNALFEFEKRILQSKKARTEKICSCGE